MMKRLLLFGALCLVGFGTTALWADETPTYYATYYVNGHPIATEPYKEGEKIKLPVDNPTDIHVEDNLELVGWLKNRDMGDAKELNAPDDMVTEAWMETEDVSYYAVFAEPLVYKLTSGMIRNGFHDQKWDDNESRYYTDYSVGGTVHWAFKGFKDSLNYGGDKLIIGRTHNDLSPATSDQDGYKYYLSFEAPKAIQKVTVGIVYYEKEWSKVRNYEGKLYLRHGANNTTNQSAFTVKGNSLYALTPNTPQTKFYLQVGNGDIGRIYAVKLECGLGAYRTKLDVQDITIASSGYGTVCLPWHAELPSGVKAYRLKEMDLTKTSGQLHFAEVTEVAQNQGYLLQGNPGTYTFYRIYSEPVDADSTNLMKGVTTDFTWRGSIISPNAPFILNNGCFKEYTGDYIPAYKAYIVVNPNEIQYDNQQNSAELRMVLEDKVEETSELAECIEEFEAKPTRIYDLSGKQVPQMKRGGFYIVNGKSVLVK